MVHMVAHTTFDFLSASLRKASVIATAEIALDLLQNKLSSLNFVWDLTSICNSALNIVTVLAG